MSAEGSSSRGRLTSITYHVSSSLSIIIGLSYHLLAYWLFSDIEGDVGDCSNGRKYVLDRVYLVCIADQARRMSW